MNRLRILTRYAITLIAAWLLGSILFGIVAAEGALHPGRRPLASTDEVLAQSIAARNHAEIREAAVGAADGVTLHAWSIRPGASNGDAAILLHGQADNRAGMLGNADLLLRYGYSVLLPDARSHGESGGSVATYGFFEADDVQRWVQWLERTQNPRCIDGIGESMGGAELLSSLRTGAGFCAVVAESTFSSFRSASYERLGQAFHTGPWLSKTLLSPAVEIAFLYARMKYGADLARVSPRDVVAASQVPVLLIHGREDTNLVPRNSERIREGNPRVELWEPASAGHCGASGAAPAEYERRVMDRFARHPSR